MCLFFRSVPPPKKKHFKLLFRNLTHCKGKPLEQSRHGAKIVPLARNKCNKTSLLTVKHFPPPALPRTCWTASKAGALLAVVILSWVGSESWQAELLPHTNTCHASELTGRRAAAAGAECSSAGGGGERGRSEKQVQDRSGE